MRNPHVPAAHLNTRFIVTSKSWFGGGGDLTPLLPDEPAGRVFHEAMKAAYDKHDRNYYPKYKKWCDEYFYLPHRDEPRGGQAVFFMIILIVAIGTTISPSLVMLGSHLKTSMLILCNSAWACHGLEEDRHAQLVRRGRYVEFNLST